MTPGEWVLQKLCRHPGETAGHFEEGGHAYPGAPLDLLRREFPTLPGLVRGARILDYGCGFAHQAVALIREEGAAFVCGAETNPRVLEIARQYQIQSGIDAQQMTLERQIPSGMVGSFDVAISQNSMEHFGDPAGALAELCGALRPGGHLLLTFGPPWYAPYGSHMQFFCPVPWVNLLFPERTIMRVRSRYRRDGAKHYKDVDGGLNEMSLAKCARLLAALPLEVLAKRYSCIRGLDFLGHLPLVRELFVNHVTYLLRKR